MVAQGGTNGVNTSFLFFYGGTSYGELRSVFAVFGEHLFFLKKIKGVKILLIC